ncbi:hypothetical protein [Raoultella ornithinolytica]|uniref:hypothetical protein n=1 Tax=Raoultella ornithinolytica TaxID=54291 RepID=UPI001F442EFC|nr:hypothetical protein [Raoultella ornithinolytica]MCF1304229.1 hypothetical protein [Raoultella ornithinolytica]
MRYTHFLMVPEIGASRLNQTLKKTHRPCLFMSLSITEETDSIMAISLVNRQTSGEYLVSKFD